MQASVLWNTIKLHRLLSQAMSEFSLTLRGHSYQFGSPNAAILAALGVVNYMLCFIFRRLKFRLPRRNLLVLRV